MHIKKQFYNKTALYSLILYYINKKLRYNFFLTFGKVPLLNREHLPTFHRPFLQQRVNRPQPQNEIIDDGMGFDAENTEMHVGLQNVRSRIAAMCRGELTVKSTVGVGTRVTIEIPKKKGKRR